MRRISSALLQAASAMLWQRALASSLLALLQCSCHSLLGSYVYLLPCCSESSSSFYRAALQPKAWQSSLQPSPPLPGAQRQLPSGSSRRHLFIPPATCSFAANSIAESHLEKLQQRTARLYLTRLGYNRNTPKAAVLGPAEHGGLGLFGLCAEQGPAVLEMLAKSLRAGKHALAALAWSQRAAGAGKLALEEIGRAHV